ncbi:MAG: tRNA (adenosine(37)-N6)-threonylcarbamoyltransferase complex ATPase subunit type 1 TsaE [Planctomycetota bacterium]
MSAAVVELVSEGLERTVAIGAAVGGACAVGDVVLLDGELGAGKTQFVRGMARGMGLDVAQVSSPTFVLMREYEGEGAGGDALLVHIDAYRVGSAAELADAGFTAELRGQAVTAIEWADRVPGVVALDERVLGVRLSHLDGGRRAVELRGRAALVDAARLACGDG